MKKTCLFNHSSHSQYLASNTSPFYFLYLFSEFFSYIINPSFLCAIFCSLLLQNFVLPHFSVQFSVRFCFRISFSFISICNFLFASASEFRFPNIYPQFSVRFCFRISHSLILLAIFCVLRRQNFVFTSQLQQFSGRFASDFRLHVCPLSLLFGFLDFPRSSNQIIIIPIHLLFTHTPLPALRLHVPSVLFAESRSMKSILFGGGLLLVTSHRIEDHSTTQDNTGIHHSLTSRNELTNPFVLLISVRGPLGPLSRRPVLNHNTHPHYLSTQQRRCIAHGFLPIKSIHQALVHLPRNPTFS